MAYLFGFDDELVDSLGWTRAQLIAYLSVYYLLLGVYGALLVLAPRNTWVIIIKQEEYKNLPIPVFYAFALVAILTRTIYLIWHWNRNSAIDHLSSFQQAAKLCVGVVQDWITLELAIRIHYSKGYTNISERTKEKLRLARRLLFVIITVLFIAYTITKVVVSLE